MRYDQELSHPDDIGFNLRHVIRATSGSFVCHPDDIVHWPKVIRMRYCQELSHPDDLGNNFPSYVIRMTYCTGNEYWLTHAYAIGTRAHPGSPHYGPFVMESNPNAALWDWYCFVVRLNNLLINQSIKSPVSSEAVALLWRHWNVIERHWTINVMFED